MTKIYKSICLVLLFLLGKSTLHAQCSPAVYAGPDLNFCEPQPDQQIQAKIAADYLGFTWAPVSGIVDGAFTLSPTIKLDKSRTFTLSATYFGPNVITNPDFESGTFGGVTSEFKYSPGDLTIPNTYDILTDPAAANPDYSSCEDNTPNNNGNTMMAAHFDNNKHFLYQSGGPVQPNTLYYVGFSMTKIVASATNPLPYVDINGFIFNPPFPPDPTPCRWTLIQFFWDSGPSTDATLTISFAGMDSTQALAIDDVFLRPVCMQTDTFQVVVAPPINAVTVPPVISMNTCKPFTVTLSGNGSTTGQNITHQWSTPDGNIVSGENTLTPVVDAPGLYELQVTFDNGAIQCSNTATVDVQAINPMVAWTNPTQKLTCTTTKVPIIAGFSPPGQATYQWTAGPGGNIVSGANNLVAWVDKPGDYTLVVTNPILGCTAETTVTILSNTTPPVANASAPTILCTDDVIVLSGAGSSTGPSFKYAWASPDSGVVVSGQDSIFALANTSGTYVLTVTNTVNGCFRTDTVSVTIDSLAPAVALQIPGMLDCDTKSLTISASVNPPNSILAWTAGPGGNIVGQTDTTFVTVTTPATYILTATNPANGCITVVGDTVLQDLATPVAAAQTNGTITCQQSNVILSANGSSTGSNIAYAWTAGPGGNIVMGGNTATPTVNAPGIYTLVVTNTTNGCTSSATTQVSADLSAVVAVANAPGNLTCIANTVTLNANGSTTGPNITYAWSTLNGQILSGPNTPNPVVGAAGTYSLLLTNTSSGCTSTDVAVVALDVAAPGAALSVSGVLNCKNTSVALQNTSTANPNLLTHSWTYPDNSVSNTGPVATLNVGQAGNYSVLVTNSQNGCTSTAAITVIARTPVVNTVSSQTDIRCFGAADGAISVSASGGDGNFTYLWSNDASTASISNLSGGSYTLTTTDGEGCTAVTTVVLSEPTELTLTTSSTSPSSAGASDGTATATPGGGTPNYTYLWSNDETTQTISGLTAGFYTVTVMDANGCTTSHSVEVGEGNCNLQAALDQLNPACAGLANGQATVVVSGGTLPFKYNWSNGGQQATVTGLTAGTYTVVVTDVNDCQVTATVTLTDPPALTIALSSVTNTSCATAPEGSATVAVGGGSGTIGILWSNAQSGATATGLVAGNYIATATDANGCTATATATVQAVDQIAPVIQANATTVPLGPSGSVTLTLANLGATATDNCLVSTVSIVPESFDCDDIGTKQVTLTATDNSGNSTTQTIAVTIVDNSAPTLVCSTNLTRCADDNVVEYVAPVATDNCLSLGGQFALAQGLPSGSTFPEGITTNVYTFTDAHGNVGSCSFLVIVLGPFSVALDTVVDDINNQNIGSVQVTVGGSLPNYTYVWTNANAQTVGNTQDLNGVGAGTYTLQVTDANGCTTTAGPYVVDNTSGTDNPTLTDLVGLFPNPTSGQLFAVFPNALTSADKYFAVYDATGRMVAEQFDNSLKTVAVDLSRLPDGLYSVLIRAQGQQGAWKIIVSK